MNNPSPTTGGAGVPPASYLPSPVRGIKQCGTPLRLFARQGARLLPGASAPGSRAAKAADPVIPLRACGGGGREETRYAGEAWGGSSSLITLLLFFFSVLGSSSALAQSNTYKLDDQGWTQTSAPEPGTDEAVIADARRYLAESKPGKALDLLDEFIEKYELKENPWLPDAYLLRGDAKTARGDEEDALYDYEEVCKNYTGSDAFPKAVEREVEIGIRYLGGLRRKFLGIRMVDATRVGEELLIRAAERLPDSRLAERVILELGDFYYRTRDLPMAAEAYDVFLKRFPDSEFRQKAMQRRVYANVAGFKGPRYNAAGLVEAEILINDFAQRFPADAEKAGMNDALLARIDDSLALQLLQTSKWYMRRGDEVSARLVLNRLVQRHPLSGAARDALDIMKEKGWTPPPAPGPVIADEPPQPTTNDEPRLPAPKSRPDPVTPPGTPPDPASINPGSPPPLPTEPR